MIHELRKKQGLTQEQLAKKCSTTKTYISRIENNASDIRLSTLMRIVRQEKHIQTKAETFTVEGYNSLFRHFLARMRRKTKCDKRRAKRRE
jgi:transcriptional regulator with XRE-family HTH domain